MINVDMIDIKCTHLASVQGPHGTHHHVVMDPTEETVAKVREWHSSERKALIRVEDRTGVHIRCAAEYCSAIVLDFGVLIITTHS